MGKLIFTTLYTLLAMCLSSQAFAQDVNLLKNPNFESRTAQWLKTGSSTFIIETAAPLEGTYSANWDASAAGEFFRSSTYTIPEGLKGRRCAIQMEYLWSTGTVGHILMNVDDGTNNIATFTINPTTGSVSAKATQNFECPSSGTLRFELESTANADSIRLDKMILGSGSNVVQLSQATLFGAVRYAQNVANCTAWATTGTAYASYPADADCDDGATVEGAGLLPTSVVPGIRFSSLPAGRYKIIARSRSASAGGAYQRSPFFCDAAAGEGSVQCSWAFFDGTNYIGSGTAFSDDVNAESQGVTTDQVEGTFVVSGAGLGATTYELRGAENTTGTTNRISMDADQSMEIEVWRYPSNSAEALNLETSGWFLDVQIYDSGGTNPFTMGNTNLSTYTEITAATGVLELRSGSVSAQIPCATTNPSTGLTCAAGDESLGVVFNVHTAGIYKVCAEGTYSADYDSDSYEAEFQLIETPNNAQTILQEGGGKPSIRRSAGVPGSVNIALNVCGTFNFTSAGQKTIRLMREQLFTGAPNGHGIVTDRLGTAGQRDLRFYGYPINQQMPAPVFTDVQNKANAGETGVKIVSAYITNAGSPTVTRQTGNWISSLTDNGTGDTTINITGGTFSQQPTCSCTPVATTAGQMCFQDSTVAQSATLVRFQTNNDAGTTNDLDINIICIGK